MTDDIPSTAAFWGLRVEEIHVLFLVCHWYNGKTIDVFDEPRRIATHREPPLEDLFRATKWDYAEHEHAHQRLLDNGFLQEEYVCRRKIDWSPTQQGLRAMRDCLGDWTEKLRPHWADDDADGPIFGDPNEGLLHRKGVEVAAQMLSGMSWAHEPNGRPYWIDRYPEDGRGEACHDLHVGTTEHLKDVGVEVLTANNNGEYLTEKWKRHAKEDLTTWWICDSRSTACRLFNELHRREVFCLDGGPFTEPANWSAEAINRKLWRSKDDHRGKDASDIVHTITGVFEGDRAKIQELFEAYYENT